MQLWRNSRAFSVRAVGRRWRPATAAPRVCALDEEWAACRQLSVSTMTMCARITLIVVMLGSGLAIAGETVVQGAQSWTWQTYQSKLAPFRDIYSGYPIGLNIDNSAWWTVQLDRSKFTFRATDVASPSPRSLRHVVSYGSAINIDNDTDMEILQCGWRSRDPAAGHFVVADFNGGNLVGFEEHAIDGCSNIWELKGRSGQPPLIVVVGLDEGKLGTTALDHAVAETFIYNHASRSLVSTGIMMTSHESTVVDLDKDGDEDILSCNWQEPANGALIFLRNDGSSLTAVPLGPPLHMSCMGVEVADLDGDGDWEVLITDGAPDPTNGIQPERNQVFHLNSDLSLTFVQELPLPYFEQSKFDGLLTVPGWAGNVGLSHDVQMVRGDIDSDGDQDVIMSSMIWNIDRPMSVFQILINDGGSLSDQTDVRLFNQLSIRDASHNFLLKDVNGDGFPDIVSQGHFPTHCCGSNIDTSLTHANTLFINDGTGHFVNTVAYQLGEFLGSPLTFSIFAGKPRWTQFKESATPGVATVMVSEFAESLSTGPGGINPAIQGAPGFNEFYYLRSFPDAAASVRAGTDATGLDHYLRVGRVEQRLTFARHATVQGWDGPDLIDLRDGNETAYGYGGDDVIKAKGGNDIIIGGPGRDTMTGGTGIDVFKYGEISHSPPGPTLRDFITDFASGQDKIDLSGIDANSLQSGKQVFKWIATRSFVGHPGELRFMHIDDAGTNNDRTIVQADINGDKESDLEIELNGLLSLRKSDFVPEPTFGLAMPWLTILLQDD